MFATVIDGISWQTNYMFEGHSEMYMSKTKPFICSKTTWSPEQNMVWDSFFVWVRVGMWYYWIAGHYLGCPAALSLVLILIILILLILLILLPSSSTLSIWKVFCLVIVGEWLRPNILGFLLLCNNLLTFRYHRKCEGVGFCAAIHFTINFKGLICTGFSWNDSKLMLHQHFFNWHTLYKWKLSQKYGSHWWC